MLKDNASFSSFSVNDLQKAKEFYQNILGLNVSEANGMLDMRSSSGARTMIYPKPDHTPATFTVLNFYVKDINETVSGLNRQGVAFEKYDFEDYKTDDKGIMRDPQMGMAIAWFKDPAGNILSVIEEAPKA